MSEKKPVPCPDCGHQAKTSEGFYSHQHTKHPNPETDPDWTKKCENCGETPILPSTGMCGPCTFGEAATAGGNW
jgi:hypothetical protein